MAAGYAFFQIVNNSLQQNINNILESQSTKLQNNPIFALIEMSRTLKYYTAP